MYIGIRTGMPFGHTIAQSQLKLTKSATIEQNIIKLQKGRLDAMIAYTPDAYIAFDNLNLKPFPHALEKPLAIHPDAVVCKGISAEFMAELDKGILQQTQLPQ